MRAPLIQRNVNLVSLVLTGLYESQQDIKAGYRYWKERVKESPDDPDVLKAAEDYRKALPKFRKRIRALEELQLALKHEMKCQQCLEMWQTEDDSFWLEWAKMEREEGYVVPCVVPPEGWYCTRGEGHEGPCAAWPVEEYCCSLDN